MKLLSLLLSLVITAHQLGAAVAYTQPPGAGGGGHVSDNAHETPVEATGYSDFGFTLPAPRPASGVYFPLPFVDNGGQDKVVITHPTGSRFFRLVLPWHRKTTSPYSIFHVGNHSPFIT